MMLHSVDPDAEIEWHNHDTMAARLTELTESGHDDFVIVADCIPNDQSVVEAFVEALGADNVAVFDHHQGTDYIEQWDGSRHDLDACATLIMARELDVDEQHMAFAELIDVADRFLEDDQQFPHARQMSDLHNFLGQDGFLQRGPAVDFDETEQFVVDHLDRQKQERIQQAVDDVQVFDDSEGRKFGFTLINESEVGNAICEDDQIDYCMMWSSSRPESVSLCSREGGTDVSEIAKQRGGGGHAHASGYSVPVDLVTLLSKELQG